MSIDHLSDEELQSYLDEKSIRNTAAVEHHLQSCIHCRRQLIAYRLIHAEFHAEPEKDFSRDFEDDVIKRIHEIESRRFQLKNYLLLFFSMTVCISLMAYGFLNTQYRSIVSQAVSDSWNRLTMLIHDVIHGSELFTGTIEIVLFAGIILLFFGFLDRIFVYPKGRKMTIFHCL